MLPADLACVKDGARVEVAVADLPVDEPLVDIGHAAVAEYAALHRRRRHRVRQRPGRRLRAAGDRVRHAGAVGGHGGVTPRFSALGGGDSVAAMNRFGLADRFDYVCTAGGAMVQFLSGKPMPVIEALKDVRRRASADGR